MKLSERIKRSRIDRPDEWTMDEYARQAAELEADLRKLLNHAEKVAEYHLRGNTVPERYLDGLSNTQLDIGQRLRIKI